MQACKAYNDLLWVVLKTMHTIEKKDNQESIEQDRILYPRSVIDERKHEHKIEY